MKLYRPRGIRNAPINKKGGEKMRIKCKKFECKEKIGDICVHSMKECKKSKKCKYIKEPCESCAIPYNYSKEIKE